MERVDEHALKFDVDDFGRYGWGSPLVNELYEDLVVAIKSLQTQYPKIGKAVIKRTLGGFHIVFPESRLPFWLVICLTQKFPHDFGQLWWSKQHGRVTLRISEKPIVTRYGRKIIHDKPQTIRIIHPDGKTLYTAEIQRRYGNV